MRIERARRGRGRAARRLPRRPRRLARRGAAADRRRPRAASTARTRAKRHALHGGERVEVLDEPEVAEVEAPEATFEVAWEDEHLLVVDKPAGVVVHPARGHASGTLAQALERRGAAGGEPGRAGLVHRLDRDTSGLLVVARSEEVHAALKAALQGARDPARVPGAGRGPAGRAHGQDRGAAGPRPPRPHAHLDRHRRRRAPRSRTSRPRRRSSATRCCACGSRRGARTRSART